MASIRQVIGMHTDIIRIGVALKAHGFDVRAPEQERLANAMHAVHDSTIARKDHRVGSVAFLDEAGVLYNVPTGQMGRSFARPVGLVDFSNRSQRNTFTREPG